MVASSGIYTLSSSDVYTGELKARQIYRDFRQFELALSFYEKEFNRVPPSSIGLEALLPDEDSDLIIVQRGFIRTIDDDPWGRPYHYKVGRGEAENDYQILTYGSDGMPGGDGLAADCENTEDSETKCMSEHTASKKRSDIFVAIWASAVLLGTLALPGIPLYVVGMFVSWRRKQSIFVGYHLFAFLYVLLLFAVLLLSARF